MLDISIKKKILSGSLWAISGKFLTIVLGFIVNALLARLISPNILGVYFLSFSLVGFLAIAAQMGLNHTIVRLIAESISKKMRGRAKQSIIISMKILFVNILIMGMILVSGFGEWISINVFHSIIMSQIIVLATLWMAGLAFQNFISETFRGYHDVQYATIFGGFLTSLVVSLSLGLVFLTNDSSDLETVLIITCLSLLFNAVVSLIKLNNKLKRTQAKKKSTDIVQILKITWPIWVTNLILFSLTQIDLWLVGLLLSKEDVAIYGVAAKTVLLIALPLMIVNSVVPPIIAEYYWKDKKSLEKSLRLTATLSGIPSIIGFFIFLIFGEQIIKLIYGEYYTNASAILIILSIGQISNVLSGSCGITLNLTGNQLVMMGITVISGLMTLMIAFFFINLYGALGAAYAASGGVVFQNILMLLATKKMVGIWTHIDISILRNKQKIN